jgi:hypothetical protein
MSLFFSKTEDQNVNQGVSGVGTTGREKDIRKGNQRVNTVETLHTHMKEDK